MTPEKATRGVNPWYEALKPLLGKWDGILELTLNGENEPIIHDRCNGNDVRLETIVKVYRGELNKMTDELDGMFMTEHRFHGFTVPGEGAK